MLGRILVLLAGAYVVVAALVFLFQRRLQYHPDPDPVPAPDGVIPVTLETAGGVRIEAWDWPGERETTLVYFHGNAGHRGDRKETLARFRELGWSVFVVDYRGYGGSGGSPTEEGLYRDAEAVADHLEGRDVVYFGSSLGCGVAVELAARRPPKALVLKSGAASLADVGQRAYPWLPVRLLMKDRFDAARRIGAVSCPVLFLHGTDDDLIPVEMGRALFEAANEPKRWIAFEGAGHNDLPWAPGYYEAIHEFLERVVG